MAHSRSHARLGNRAGRRSSCHGGRGWVGLRSSSALSPWRNMASVATIIAFLLAGSRFNSAWPHTFTAGLLAAAVLILAWAYRAVPLTWAGSALLVACLGHALSWRFPVLELRHPWILALLTHASLVFLGSLTLNALGRRTNREGRRDAGNDGPFNAADSRRAARSHGSGLLICFPAARVDVAWEQPLALTVYAGWMSVIWLGIALSSGRPELFAAFQTALTVTVLFGVHGLA